MHEPCNPTHDRRDHLGWQFVPDAGQHHEPRAGDADRERLAVRQGQDRVLLAVDHQHRLRDGAEPPRPVASELHQAVVDGAGKAGRARHDRLDVGPCARLVEGVP